MPHPEEPRNNDNPREPVENAAFRAFLESKHRYFYRRIRKILEGEGFGPDDAHDGFVAAYVELDRNSWLWKEDVVLTKETMLPFLLRRARWRARDLARRRWELPLGDPGTIEREHGECQFWGGAEPRLEPGDLLELDELRKARELSYRIARNTVVWFFPTTPPGAIDRRWWWQEPYREIAKDFGMNYTTLHRRVDFCNERYDVLGPPDSPSYDVKAVKRLMPQAPTLIVVLGHEIDRDDRDDRLVKRLPCSERDNETRAWICEVLPPERTGGADG